MAYATLAGLPPQFGLYCAMLPAIAAALWGSSWHQVSGPTNAIALVVFATMTPLAAPGTDAYIELVLTLALLVGLLQFAMGVARLGALVNFISHTVVIGFTAGAGLLIIAAQLRNFFGVPIPSGARFFETLNLFARGIADLDPWITATGAVTLVVALAAKRWLPRIAVHGRRDDRGQPVRLRAARHRHGEGARRRRAAVGHPRAFRCRRSTPRPGARSFPPRSRSPCWV